MALEIFVEDVESLDESLREHYKPVEEGEGYMLDATPKDGYAIENVEGLKSALGKERSSRKDFETKYNKVNKQFEGVDLDELKSFKTKYEELSALDPEKEADKLAQEKVKDTLARKQKEWQKQYEKEVGERDQKITGLTSQVQKLMIDDTATKALVEAGIVKDHLELILPKVVSSMKLNADSDGKISVDIVDSEGNPRVRGDGNNMTVADLIPELQTKWPSSFTASQKQGTGTESQGKAQRGATNKDQAISSTDKIIQGLESLRNRG